jgi:hypothetical protein
MSQGSFMYLIGEVVSRQRDDHSESCSWLSCNYQVLFVTVVLASLVSMTLPRDRSIVVMYRAW